MKQIDGSKQSCRNCAESRKTQGSWVVQLKKQRSDVYDIIAFESINTADRNFRSSSTFVAVILSIASGHEDAGVANTRNE